MYGFRTLSGDDPLLDQSPLVRALDYLDKKFDENPKGIPLTKTKMAFKRDLVAEAITEIQWPHWTEAEIYHGTFPIKVASEDHFVPFWRLHQHLRHLHLVHYYKGNLLLTKTGKTLFADRFARFNRLVQYVVFDNPRMVCLRKTYGLIDNWDHWLNVLDVETTYWASSKELSEIFSWGEGESDVSHRGTTRLYDGLLKPLMYCGLLEENRCNGYLLVERIYRKTELWSAYLQLDEKPPKLASVH